MGIGSVYYEGPEVAGHGLVTAVTRGVPFTLKLFLHSEGAIPWIAQYDCLDRTPRKTSRREVLKFGAAAAAGTALAGVSVPRVHAAEDNTIRLALIGCGGRGSGAVGDAFSVADGPVHSTPWPT